MAHELNDADEQILNLLASGRNLPQNLATKTGYSRQYVQNRLQMLKAADLVDNLGGGLYEITDDGRHRIDASSSQLDVDELRDAVTDARDAYESVNGDGVEDALDRMERLLAE
ncbi:hypothetical protein JT689_01580 (plasmid) [Halobacterium sp. GSL-19]|uniref:hypothetical protein n=1 Tax=Halobacterium sp. GSL-19 TaxID=2812551 RepID=UPI0019626A6B|nr:hypothetical protein [Halobacterium sp. GSL-19]QRY21781.1 hypothetical protein JT689_01580 [Halobacterium sp. GSL-19]